MRKTLLSVCLAVVIAAPLYAQQVDKEGQLWLDRNSESAEVNVNGVWSTESWGNITLEQPQGSREIKGDGDSWKIEGVVSGKRVFLLFSDVSRSIGYSAELIAENDALLTGSYSSGLKDKPGDNRLVMTKKSNAVAMPAVGGEKETARMIVYRKSRGAPGVNPSIYLDGRQLVWMKKDYYFSFRVSPNAHVISSHPDEKPLTIDAVPGNTYYIESSVGGQWVRIYGNVKLVPDEKAKEALKQLKPLPASNVLAESIVSLDPISIK